jgi:hypothetical protein
MLKIEKRALPFLLAGSAAAVLLAVGMFPAELPEKTSPTFIDTIFENRGVIWAARLLLVSAAAVLAFGGVFIVASTAIRMKNGEWLRRAGPFEVSEGVGTLDRQAEHWREVAAVRQEHVDELTEQLDESDELIEQLRGVLSEREKT